MRKNPLAKIGLIILLLVLALPTLSACGKKGTLEFPDGKKTDYPRKYPTR